MNLFDLCQAIGRGIGKGIKWLVNGLGEMIRLSFRQWWIVLIFVALCLAAALYYSREDNRKYEVDVVANLNGITNSMVRAEFDRLNKSIHLFDHQNLSTLLGIDAELAQLNNHFETFDRAIVFAKSIDGLTFRGNVIVQNEDFPAFHKNQTRFRFLRTKNVVIENNDFSDGDASISEE